MLEQFGRPVRDALAVVRRSEVRWGNRGESYGLLDGTDEPLGWGIPHQFKAFLDTGIDAVHEGFWVDHPDQSYEPFIVYVSPVDMRRIILEAATASEWVLGCTQAKDDDIEPISDEFRARALDRRRELGLYPIPETHEEIVRFLGEATP